MDHTRLKANSVPFTNIKMLIVVLVLLMLILLGIGHAGGVWPAGGMCEGNPL